MAFFTNCVVDVPGGCCHTSTGHGRPSMAIFVGGAAMATLLLSVMGAFATFERAVICERQRERIQTGASKSLVAREWGISRETLSVSPPAICRGA